MVEHIATAEFLSEAPLERHVRQRVADEQWQAGLTASELRSDMARFAIYARMLGIYTRRGGAMACLLSEVEGVVEPQRRGPYAEALAIVVYSIDRGKVITAYQFSAMTQLSMPEDARWFRLTPLP